VGQDNIIELNGKRYDAVTGAFLGESRIKTMPSARGTQAHRGRVIDGFVRPNKAATSLTPAIAKPAQPPKTSSSQVRHKSVAGKKMDIQRAPQLVKAHQPERSKTLMRHAVSKPKTTIKPAIKTTAPTEMMARPTSTLAKPLEKKLSVAQVNPVRLARAKQVAKSHHIRRFSRQQAEHQPRATVAAPVVRAAAPRTQSTVQTTHAAATPVTAHVAQTAPQQNAADIFEAALAHAISHEQLPQQHTKRRRSHRRLVNTLAGIGAFLVIGGFITYLNMPAIELQVASVRAGFHAEIPGYRPTGYALDGGIKSSAGKISMSFRSGDSAYHITQEASDWNSATLLDQKAEEQGAPAQTIQSKGRIIYIYDDNNATWVNGGVRYEISGNATLDEDELVSLATSM
jgi:hypothetical protein